MLHLEARSDAPYEKTAEALAAHVGWIRKLARELVRDRHLADVPDPR